MRVFSLCCVWAATARALDTVSIEPWGDSALRVRIAPDGRAIAGNLPGALAATPDRAFAPSNATVTSGNLRGAVDPASGRVLVV